ncbi:uncharacterized protein L203_103620 [Cryptococcus depauperatus CBS 7841]|uniref:RNA helicase n=1 Tax=Cryptococcus depauperatus CBS 7841 TaxID=1295531 RepID=A0AAJ8M293_9TREE
MGKKKLSLKPVQRGFATTSMSSKKPTPSIAESGPKDEEQGPEEALKEDLTDAKDPNGEEKAAEWDDDEVLEQNALQTLVDRLQEKGEKEVTRIIKGIELDRRLASSFPDVMFDKNLRDEALEMALGAEKAASLDSPHGPIKTFPSLSAAETEKGLLRFFITYQVLQRLGFGNERIHQCILEGIKEGGGWEEAIEWMWLHVSEDECLQQGEFTKKEECEVSESQPETLVPAPVECVPPPTDTNVEKQSSSNVLTNPAQIPVAPSTMFHSLSQSDSDTDSNDDDGSNIHQQWAKFQLELDNIRLATGGGKKGKKSKSIPVLETPEVRSLKEKIGKIEKEYIFNRKAADALLKVLKNQRDVSAVVDKFRNASIQDKAAKSEPESIVREVAEEDKVANTDEDVSNQSENDSEGGLFNGMLDEPEPSSTSKVDTSSEKSTLFVRPMPIPKLLSSAATIPKNILKAILNKQTKRVAIFFVNLSGTSRAARSGLEIRWEGKRKVWKMEDIACENMQEAENYVSTLALSDLEAEKVLTGVNWRTMPPAYRELWEETKAKRKEHEDESRRCIWKIIKELWDKKAVEKPVEKVERSKSLGNATPLGQDNKIQERINVYNQKLQNEFLKRQDSASYRIMLQQRNALPIASFRDQIIATLDANQIMVFSGETGCGKSTQLPSFILEDQLSQGKSCKIIVTEPRRISAISLAQRVSQELGDDPGAVGTSRSLIGYSIRLESKVSTNTRLSFVTNGIALRMLESGSSGNSKGTAFDEITHIIVDEVHERSIESDFLLIVLKNICEIRKDLKVVLMSATVDAEKISNYFGGCPVMCVPGRTFPVQVNYLEDAVELVKWHIDESSPYAIRGRKFKSANQLIEWNEEGTKSDSDPEDDNDNLTMDPAKLSSTKYCSETVNTINLLDSRHIPYDLIVCLLEKICYKSTEFIPFSQAILIFMPGLAEIRKLNDMLLAHPQFGSQYFVVWPLHSSISNEGQSAVFVKPPKGVRKIVISTNIAETGVTIPDVTCVIDSGKQREMRYDEKRQMSRFVETYVARSNAKQRRGRAGRVQEGLAFHLFTKAKHDTQLSEYPVPEMLRLSLQDLALRIKILRAPLGKTIESVLLQALDPPSSINIQRAVASLVEVKALTLYEDITPLGKLLSKLPMDVHLSKFLLVATMLGCLDPALTVAATLNSKSPFVTPFGFESQARAAKQSFAVGNSDFLTIANVFMSWRKASDNPRFVQTFCRKNFVSLRNLQQIEELRQQLLAYLIDSSFVNVNPTQRQAISQSRFSRGVQTHFVPIPPELNTNGENFNVLNAALVAGLYPKLLVLDESGSMKTISNQQSVVIHPSSVNFKLPYNEFESNYLIYFTIMHSKRLYAWEVGPVENISLALLGGDIADFKVSASSLILDRKIKYHIQPKLSIAIKHIREQFAQAMSQRFRGRKLTAEQQEWLDLGIKYLIMGIEEQKEEQGRVGVL